MISNEILLFSTVIPIVPLFELKSPMLTCVVLNTLSFYCTLFDVNEIKSICQIVVNFQT